jgi:hypothetical protein
MLINLQVADALKLILKEYVAPTQANLILFFLGPIVTLIFALLGYAVIPYGPGLSLGDMELGILYMLAVSGLATYGILLAGFPNHFFTYLHLHTKNTKNTQYRMSKYPSQHFNNSGFINKTVKVSLARKCFIHTGNNQSNNSNINKEQFVLDLFRDRTAPVIPFDRDLVKGSCSDYTNKISRTTFLKNWGSKAGIYIIEYKHYPNIYYIGRTNLFKKRFFEHSKAESNSKFHLFIRLIGMEHFNLHILEICPETKLGERETYYLQKYIPILNSVFSSSITEGVIKQTLLLKLKDLRAINKSKDGRAILVYVYDITEIGINPQPTVYNSSNEASRALAYSISSILKYKNTLIPYRGKLFFNYPVTDFDKVFKESQKLTPKGLLNRVISTKVWAYNAQSLELIINSPFPSKNKAAKALGIPRATLDLVLDKGRTAGAKAIYLYSKRLNAKEILALQAKAGSLQLGLKVPVYVYDANTLELINNKPFDSLLEAADYFGVDYRTISRHLNTNKATKRGDRLVYFFKQILDAQLSKQLLTAVEIGDSRNYNTKVWVYISDNMELINSRPFDSISSAVSYLGISKSTIYRNLDTDKPVSLRKVKLNLYFFTKKVDS